MAYILRTKHLYYNDKEKGNIGFDYYCYDYNNNNTNKCPFTKMLYSPFHWMLFTDVFLMKS